MPSPSEIAKTLTDEINGCIRCSGIPNDAVLRDVLQFTGHFREGGIRALLTAIDLKIGVNKGRAIQAGLADYVEDIPREKNQ